MSIATARKRRSLPNPTLPEEIVARDSMRRVKKIMERRDLSAEQKDALIQSVLFGGQAEGGHP